MDINCFFFPLETYLSTLAICVHIQIPPTSYVGLKQHSTAVTTVEDTMRVLSMVDLTRATVHAVAAEYLRSTLSGTSTCSSHSSTALYETYVAGQEES